MILAVKTQVFWANGSKTPVFSQLNLDYFRQHLILAVKTQVFWTHDLKIPVFSQLNLDFFRLFRLFDQKLRARKIMKNHKTPVFSQLKSSFFRFFRLFRLFGKRFGCLGEASQHQKGTKKGWTNSTF